MHCLLLPWCLFLLLLFQPWPSHQWIRPSVSRTSSILSIVDVIGVASLQLPPFSSKSDLINISNLKHSSRDHLEVSVGPCYRICSFWARQWRMIWRSSCYLSVALVTRGSSLTRIQLIVEFASETMADALWSDVKAWVCKTGWIWQGGYNWREDRTNEVSVLDYNRFEVERL